MAILGSCLCGGVRFELRTVTGPAEICHCVRCQKKSGATALTTMQAKASDYNCLAGAELIQRFEAPILNRPPAYTAHFCSVCGSPVPPAEPEGDTVEIPAGLFDTDPGVDADKHIFTDFMHDWDRVIDGLPQYDFRALMAERWGREVEQGVEMLGHDGRIRRV